MCVCVCVCVCVREMQCFGPLSVPVHKVALCSYLKGRKILYREYETRPGSCGPKNLRSFSLNCPLKMGLRVVAVVSSKALWVTSSHKATSM